MKVLVLSHSDVRALLPMAACIDLMATALATLARGDAVQPLRSATWQPDRRGLLGVMPAYLGGDVGAPGIKVVTVFPSSHGTPFDSHQGAVLLFEGERGSLLAIVDGGEVTAMRTAAVSALATRLLARADASTLALLGSGVQARTHLQGVCAVRPVASVRVWSRNPANARRFAEREARRHGIPVEVTASPRDAVDGADVVCTTTSSAEPVLEGSWLAPGVHINAVGACTPNARELDTEAVRRSRLFVDRRESALAESGDVLVPLRENAIDEGHIAGELGDILVGRTAGRVSDDDITLFDSLGIGVEDLAAAHHCYRAAVERDVGTWVELGGRRDDAE